MCLESLGCAEETFVHTSKLLLLLFSAVKWIAVKLGYKES